MVERIASHTCNLLFQQVSRSCDLMLTYASRSDAKLGSSIKRDSVASARRSESGLGIFAVDRASGNYAYEKEATLERRDMGSSSSSAVVKPVMCAKCGKEIPAGREVVGGFLMKKNYHVECAPIKQEKGDSDSLTCVDPDHEHLPHL